MCANVFDEKCAQIALFQKRVELSRAHFHDRKFAGDKECIQHDKRGNRRQLSKDQHWRIPMGCDASEHHCRQKYEGDIH